MAFCFIIGDEGFFEQSKASDHLKVFGVKPSSDSISTRGEFQKLMKTYNVFHLRKEYADSSYEQKMYKQWC